MALGPDCGLEPSPQAVLIGRAVLHQDGTKQVESAAAVQATSYGGGKYGEQTNARDRVASSTAAPLGGQSHHDVYEK